jgi:uncharacterized protein (TIGR02270 family)
LNSAVGFTRESIPEVVDQHAEEAAFLWHLRDVATASPHYRLRDFIELDSRVEAHADGLRVAGDFGWKIALANAGKGGPSDAFAATLAAAAVPSDPGLACLFDLARKKPRRLVGIVAALGWMPFTDAEPRIRRLLESGHPLELATGLRACGLHRHNPGRVLESAWYANNEIIRIAAYDTAGHLGVAFGYPQDDMKSEFRALQLAAARIAAVQFQDSAALRLLRAEASSENCVESREALAIAARALSLSAVRDWWEDLCANDEIRTAVKVAGVSGDPYYLNWLESLLTDRALARVAGEAIQAIAGIDLYAPQFRVPAPRAERQKPADDAREHDVVMDEDRDLPWPNVVAVRKHLLEQTNRLAIGVRFLAGEPSSPERAAQLLHSGRQRHRIIAAIVLALQDPGTGLFPFAMPGWRQANSKDL